MTRLVALLFALGLVVPAPAQAVQEDTLDSVVSVLPVWPGHAQGGQGAPPGTAPEGTAFAIRDGGYLLTAYHVVEQALRADVRLSDGRVLPVELLAADPDTDIAILRLPEKLPPLALAPEPAIGSRVCAVSNAFGLDLSVTCGVVSQLRQTHAGFDPVEDFIQTDAAANPGASGGPLLDSQDRVVGMVSAIFTRDNDANLGVNFAISAALLERVTEDLIAFGEVKRAAAGLTVGELALTERREVAGALVQTVIPGGPAEAAGLRAGDVITRFAGRDVRQASDFRTALLLSQPRNLVNLVYWRDGERRETSMTLVGLAPPPSPGAEDAAGAQTDAQGQPQPEPEPEAESEASEDGTAPPPSAEDDCAAPPAICDLRLAVFPISGFAPLASAVRIDEELLVTNRHAVADLTDVFVYTPHKGEIPAEVIPTGYPGDLILLRAVDLPEGGPRLAPFEGSLDEPLYAIGADVARSEVRVYAPGELLLPPAEDHDLARLHHTAVNQPGNSGGALVDADGDFVGVLTSGGEGRYEALPARELTEVIAASGPAAVEESLALGAAYRACTEAVEAAQPVIEALIEDCRAADNRQLLDQAAAVLGQAGELESAIALSQQALAQDPHSINGRLTMVVSLHLAARFAAALPHVRWLLDVIPEEPQVLRFAIQAGKWGGDMALAEAGYALLEEHHPAQAEAARRFLDSDIPAPQPR